MAPNFGPFVKRNGGDGMSEPADPSGYENPGRAFQFDLKSLLALVLGFGILFACSRIFSLASLLTLGVMLVSLILVERKTRWILLVLILVLLLPYGWLLLDSYPWSPYRWSWVARWPTLPGLLPSRLVGDVLFPNLSDHNYEFVFSAVTLLLLAGATVMARFNRALFWLTVSFAGLASIVSSAIQYGLFRA